LDRGIIAEFRVTDEEFVLDRGHNKNPTRARFSIAHEIGHLELHSALGGHVFCRDLAKNREEIQANRFAAALLMPAPDLVEEVAQHASELGKFSRRVAEADIVTACRWLRTVLRREPLREASIRSIAKKFGTSMQSLLVRLNELRLVSA
jgi:Zn-dependent peptidase ImmA (M78 family)